MALLDQYGNPIRREALRGEHGGPTVTGVRSILSDHPAQGLTPHRLARLLRAAESGDAVAYLELAEEMEEKDLHYRSVLSTRKMQVACLPVTVEAAGDDAQSVADADLIRTWLARDTLALELYDILDAVGKGFSATEILWDTADGLWLPARLEWRDPRWFEFDRVDGRTLRLRGLGAGEDLAPWKWILHNHQTKSGLPIRGGLARAVAWSYLFKNYDIKSWVSFLDGFGQPLRVGRFGPGATAEQKDILLTAVRNIAADAAAIIPEGMAIDFIEARISGNLDLFERMAAWLDRQTSKAVLGQTGTTDTGQHVGTANAHENVRDDIEAWDAMQLAATLNRDLIRPVIDLNRGPRKKYPRLVIRRADSEDTAGLVTMVATLVDRGLQVEQSVLRDRLGLPDPDKGAMLLHPLGAAPMAQKAAQTSLVAAHAQQDQQAPDPIDTLIADELAEWEPLVDPLLAPLRALLEDCATLEEFQRRLPELVARQDATALAEPLAQALFAARLSGETADG